MATLVLTVALAASALVPGADPVACELVDLEAARTVLGEEAFKVGGDATPGACQYRSPTGTILNIQIFAVALYDAVPITPQIEADIGDRGRYNTPDGGRANLQFAKGDYSVRITLTPLGGGEPPPAPLEALLAMARAAADGIDG